MPDFGLGLTGLDGTSFGFLLSFCSGDSLERGWFSLTVAVDEGLLIITG